MASARPYDLIVFGATGFTGRLVAEYLLGHAPSELRWAVAGRNPAKLETIKAELTAEYPAAASLDVLVADSMDAAAVARIAEQCKVVCTTVGPYAKYGALLVGACAVAGTHYCDLSGETHFVRQSMEANLTKAQETGACIVHCCGFDSIPSDIGTYMLGEAMAERGATLKQVRAFAGEMKGGPSGGTVASMANILDDIKKDPSLRKVVGHPYGLNPEGEREGPDKSDQMNVRFDKELGMWTAPFVMAAINTRVVRRSNALRKYPFGTDFRYSEAMSTGKGPRGMMRAAAMAGGLAGFFGAMHVGPIRGVLEDRFLPKPGEGPTKEERENGFFVFRLLATGETKAGQTIRLRGRIEGKKDPGYGETAKMLGESALCLAQDDLPVGGGIWTPASAMGSLLLQRLRAANMVFEVKEA
jgi:short subunit dehydrogenase-like uncharacterized protein